MSLYGLIGSGIGADPARQIHRRIIQEAGFDEVYSVFDVDGEDSALTALVRFALDGANISAVFEKTFFGHAKPVGAALATGRMDTLNIVGGEVMGYDTLGDSFTEFCGSAGVKLEGNSFCVLGSSAGAAAISRALYQSGVKSVINAGAEDVRYIDDAYGVINTLSEDVLITEAKFDIAIDLKYGRIAPKLAKCAKRYADGLYMQLAGAIAAQEIWQKKRIEKHIAEKLFLEMRGCSRLLLVGILQKPVKLTANALASRCGMTYVDMDALLDGLQVDDAEKNVAGTSCEREEAQKQQKEREDALMNCYRSVCAQKNVVIACGRRLLNDKQGMEYFRQCGFVNVFVDQPLEKIAAEMFANNEFFGENGIEALAELHEHCGDCCTKRIETDGSDAAGDRLFNMLAFDEY